MDIVEFLTARLDEEAAAAENAAGHYADGSPWGPSWTYDREHFRVLTDGQPKVTAKDTGDWVGEHIARWDPARVLAEIAAKRRIIDWHPNVNDGDCGTCVRAGWGYPTHGGSTIERWPCPTLRALAAPYADHPDYDPAWRVDD